MDATSITVVSQLINDARTRFGAAEVEAIAIDGALLDETMDHVLSAGGAVTTESCTVDGVEVRELPPGHDRPLAYLRGDHEPRVLAG